MTFGDSDGSTGMSIPSEISNGAVEVSDMKNNYTFSLIAAVVMAIVSIPTTFAGKYGQAENYKGHLWQSENKCEVKKPSKLRQIADVPDNGNDKLYSSNRICIMNDYIVDNTGLAAIVRYGEDSSLYFRDMFSLGTENWIEASIDEKGLISIPTHQFFVTDATYGDITLETSKFVELENGNTDSKILWDKDVYYLQRHDDGTITSLDTDKDWMEREYLVLTNAEGVVMALSGNIVMTPVNDEPVSPPAGCESVLYNFTYKQANEVYSQTCDVVFDNDDVYFQGLCYYFPDAWLKGTFNKEHTELRLASGQFVGHKLYVNYFSAAHRTTVEIDGEFQTVWEKDPELILEVGEDGKSFSFNNTQYFAITIADEVDYNIYSGKITERVNKAVKPVAPIIDGLYWIDVDALYFTQPLIDVDGNYIDPSNMSWRMYYDDVLFTFTPDEYMNISKPTTEIPYGFSDNWDFGFDRGEQFVAIYNTSYQSIGIESVCTVNGESIASDRVYYSQSGVYAPNETKIAESTELFDLSGKKINGKPAAGMYIRVEHFSDGTKRIVKTIVR